MKMLKHLFAACAILLTIASFAQTTVPVSGTVTDTKGEGIAGVTIKDPISGRTTVTEKDGSFTLSVNNLNGSLEISHVGYLSLVFPMNGKAVLNVQLKEDNQNLGDVIVVGYGRQRKNSLTGSVSMVKGTELVRSQAVSLSNALTGRVPGYFSKQETGKPGGDAAGFSIRGTNTLGNNSPLTLVDGIPRDINSLDPNDIESVSVLKDASAAAIFGVRGSNGVILVTTKRGKEGKPTISYSGNYGFQNVSRPYKWLTAPQFAKAVNAFNEAIGGNAVYTEEDIDIITNRPDNLRRNAQGWGLANTNWFDEVFQSNAPQTQHNISITGGAPKLKYFVSLGYVHQNGFFSTVDYKRYNIRSNVDGQITDELSFKLDISARLEKRSDIPSGVELYWPLYLAKPTDPVRYPNGLITATTNGFQPLSQADSSGYNRNDYNLFQSLLSFEYKPKWAKGITVRQILAADKGFSRGKEFVHPYQYYNYDQNADVYNVVMRPGSTNLTETASESPSYTSQTILEYSKQFNRHAINAVLVYEAAKQTSSTVQGRRINYTSTGVEELFAGPTVGATNNGFATQYARVGQAGRLDYTFDGKYIVNVSFRRDGSVNFAPGKRFGFFPGASVGWNISKENFIADNLPFINNLKLRASYGVLGNDRIVVRRNDNFGFNGTNNNPYNPSYSNVEFPYLNLFGYGNPYIVNGSGALTLFSSGVPNPNLTWETCTTKEIGLEFTGFNNRINFEAAYFVKNTRDMLNVKSDVPATFGTGSSYENAGESRVRGIELSARYNGTAGNFNYFISPNFSHAKSILVSWPDPEGTPDYLKREGNILFPFTGLISTGLLRTEADLTKSIPQYRALQLGDVGFRDMNGDGIINDNDQAIVNKSLVPQTFFGAELGVSYKNFSLSMLWQGASDFYYSPILAMQSLLFGGQTNSPQYLLDYYSATNTDANFPRLTTGLDPNNHKTSTFWTWDVTYIKLRNIQFGYSLPKNLVSKAKIQDVRLTVTATNLLMFSNLKDLDRIDPETLSYAWNNNNNNYPLTRVFTFGLNLTF
jgi:TonB-linked SusC/RagA family outer membrane protein